MRLVRSVADDEMIAAWLQAEVNSPRHQGDNLRAALVRDGKDRLIVTEPDFIDMEANAYRRSLLRECRGYERGESLFNGFPKQVAWHEARLAKNEVGGVRYLNYDYFVELSGGSRRVGDGARNVAAGLTVFSQSNDNFYQAEESLRRGTRFPPPILVAVDNESLVVIEGHARMTAYALAGDACPDEIEVLVGFSPDFAEWDKTDFG